MRLSPDDFPLIVQQTSIYGQTLNSPVLTAATPEIAILAAEMMNKMDALVRKRAIDGFFVVGPTEADLLIGPTLVSPLAA